MTAYCCFARIPPMARRRIFTRSSMAHGPGLSVVLDIVLNHFGPKETTYPCCHLRFFDAQRMTPWGNVYEREPVRHYILDAPLFWLTEYRLDGLRFDAIDQIKDTASKHILQQIAETIREALPDRHIHLTTEDSRNVIFLHPQDEKGATPLFTAEWNDDSPTPPTSLPPAKTHAYYQDFAREPEKKFARALTEGFVYQGRSLCRPDTHAVECHTQPPTFFVDFIQTTIKPVTAPVGERLITLAGGIKPAFCSPRCCCHPISLLFMGEEYGETNPFLFFTDFIAIWRKPCGKGGQKIYRPQRTRWRCTGSE